MKCPVCKGRTVEQVFVDGLVDIVPCKCCGGKGVVEPLTNEEWLRSCTTEQLAEWLVEVTQYCYECGTDVHNCECCPFGKCIDKGFAMEWLKQPHKE